MEKSKSKSKSVSLFTIKRSKKDPNNLYYAPNLSEKSPVKAITVQLQDGSSFQLTNTTLLFKEDPRERLDRLASLGYITADVAEERKAKIPDWVLAEITIKMGE